MHRTLFFLLLSVGFLGPSWETFEGTGGFSISLKQCPIGTHWIAEKNKCSRYLQVITGSLDMNVNISCPKGTKKFNSACVKIKVDPVICPSKQIYDKETKRCIDWIVEQPSTEPTTTTTPPPLGLINKIKKKFWD